MLTYMPAYTCTHIVCIHIPTTHAHTYIIYIHTCANTYTFMYKHLYTHMHTNSHIYTHIHSRIHTYTHVYSYTHI